MVGCAGRIANARAAMQDWVGQKAKGKKRECVFLHLFYLLILVLERSVAAVAAAARREMQGWTFWAGRRRRRRRRLRRVSTLY